MLLYIDIDHFRSINENMGMEVGDLALAMLAERLRGELGPEARLWRHASDEFVAAVPQPARPAGSGGVRRLPARAD